MAEAALDFDGWRAQARAMLRAGVPPEAAQWQAIDDDLFGAPGVLAASGNEAPGAQLRVPRKLMQALECAACFRADDRWAFLYRVLWRYLQGQHDVVSPADVDGARLSAMVKAVRREIHDMHAYIRFRERPEQAGAPRFVAWFEPQHDVLAQVAEHFQRRMGKVSWMIATPTACVLWDGRTLQHTGPLIHSAAELEDEGEALWLTYYRSIFNPARLNTQVMQSHIPARFWKHLPEGAVVPELVSQASRGARRLGQLASVTERSGRVIAIAPERAQPSRAQPSRLDQCRRCALWEHATQAVPGVGPQQAGIMLVGEQPGDQEDLAGLPFVGPAGKVLDDALAQSGLTREALFLTNAVKHFKWTPRGKRRLHKTPAQQEVAACYHWLEQELNRCQPRVVVTLGATALHAIMRDAHLGLTEHLGQALSIDGYWVVPVYHPAYVLRVPDAKARAAALAQMVAGFQLAQRLLGAAPSHNG